MYVFLKRVLGSDRCRVFGSGRRVQTGYERWKQHPARPCPVMLLLYVLAGGVVVLEDAGGGAEGSTIIAAARMSFSLVFFMASRLSRMWLFFPSLRRSVTAVRLGDVRSVAGVESERHACGVFFLFPSVRFFLSPFFGGGLVSGLGRVRVSFDVGVYMCVSLSSVMPWWGGGGGGGSSGLPFVPSPVFSCTENFFPL